MESETREPYLSVVIPAYNEQERIADSLYTVKEYLAKQDYPSEVIVVDDGSSDWTTEVVRTIDIYGAEIQEQDAGTVMENVKNVGKGFSVARGMLKASGKIILFTDADLSTPIQEVEKLLPHLEQGFDVVIGSRGLKESDVEKKPFYRNIMSWIFHAVVSLFAIRGVKDTQCGFKAFSQEAGHTIARLQRFYGFSFDVEQLFIASRLGYRVKEVPVKWTHAEGSKVNPLKDAAKMFLDVMLIRLVHRHLAAR